MIKNEPSDNAPELPAAGASRRTCGVIAMTPQGPRRCPLPYAHDGGCEPEGAELPAGARALTHEESMAEHLALAQDAAALNAQFHASTEQAFAAQREHMACAQARDDARDARDVARLVARARHEKLTRNLMRAQTKALERIAGLLETIANELGEHNQRDAQR